MIRKNIPNFLTCCNLFFGCMAVVSAFEMHWANTMIYIVMAGVIDFLDGFVARFLKAQSEIGKELDSLADMVSFGLVPGLVLYQIIGVSGMSYPLNLLGFTVTIFSALRLAKFNTDSRQTSYFIGLPTPANTFLIVSLSLMKPGDLFYKSLSNPLFLIIITLFSCFLLVSEIRMFSLKFKSFSFKGNELQYFFLLSSGALLVLFFYEAIPLIIILYVVLSLFWNLSYKFRS